MPQSDDGTFIDARLTTNDDGEPVVRVTWHIEPSPVAIPTLPRVPYPAAMLGVPEPPEDDDPLFWPAGDRMVVSATTKDDGSLEREIDAQS